MGSTALYALLWLLISFTRTTQELAKLSVSPEITAECGRQVTLNCNVSSSLDQLSVKRMQWFHRETSLCSVDSNGNIIHGRLALRDFQCEYKHGQLSLLLRKVQPLWSGDYCCKLQSNRGSLHKKTRVELQERSGIVEGVMTTDGPSCTFSNFYPDGDVHWFHGPHRLSAEHNTTKREDEEGCLTIHSFLKHRSSDVPYNCTLKSLDSGRYIASALVQSKPWESPAETEARAQAPSHKVGNGVGPQGPMSNVLCISIFLVGALN